MLAICARKTLPIVRSRGSRRRTSSPPSEISAVWPRDGHAINLQLDVEFARQPLVPAPVADIAQAQEDHATRLESLRQPPHVLAGMVDHFAMCRRADRGLLDFSCAVRHCADEARVFAGVA